DSTIPWAQIPPFLQAAAAARLPYVAYWDESDHTGDQTSQYTEFIQPRTFYNSTKPGFNIFAFSRTRSFLAFSDCSLDQNAGNGSSTNGDAFGGINRYGWWDNATIVDTPTRYEVRPYLLSQSPASSTTVTVTVRNIQRLA